MTQKNEETLFPATVVSIIDEYNVAINRGANHGISIGKRFALYGTSDEEIIDPETGESLGLLEIFKGNGKIVNVQPKMSTLQSTRKKPAKKEIIYEKQPYNPFITATQTLAILKGENKRVVELPEEDLPFKDPQLRDKAKPI